MNLFIQTIERFKSPVQLPPLESGQRFGLDWAWGHLTANQLHAQGASFAGRYLSTDPGKNLGPTEARVLSVQGVDIICVYETTANRSAEGYQAGVNDARYARVEARACGKPEDRPIFFAVDFDTSGGVPQGVIDYFKGVNSILGVSRTGAYGGYNTMRRLFGSGLITFGWQTLAWSGGLWHPRAGVQQFAIEHSVDGVDCDYNRATATDFGQWRVGQTPRKVGPDKLPLIVNGNFDKPTIYALQYCLNHKPRAPKIHENGVFDKPTRARLDHYLRARSGGSVACKKLQRHVRARVDGIWGADTTRHLQIALNTHKF